MTDKHIRPIAAYKRVNPELYKHYNDIVSVLGLKAGSSKQKENNFYHAYGMYMCGESVTEDKTGFFVANDNYVNICTITEMGRLLLTGWYYNIENFTIDICRKLYNAYAYKKNNNIVFNDLEFAKAIIYIRENAGYYYHNEDELKIYLLNHFFEKETKDLLPPAPKIFQIIDIVGREKKNNLKSDKDYYYKRADFLDSYVEHLQDVLDEYNISYQTEDEHKEIYDKEEKEIISDIVKEIDEHEEKCKAILLKSNLLT